MVLFVSIAIEDPLTIRHYGLVCLLFGQCLSVKYWYPSLLLQKSACIVGTFSSIGVGRRCGVTGDSLRQPQPLRDDDIRSRDHSEPHPWSGQSHSFSARRIPIQPQLSLLGVQDGNYAKCGLGLGYCKVITEDRNHAKCGLGLGYCQVITKYRSHAKVVWVWDIFRWELRMEIMPNAVWVWVRDIVRWKLRTETMPNEVWVCDIVRWELSMETCQMWSGFGIFSGENWEWKSCQMWFGILSGKNWGQKPCQMWSGFGILSGENWVRKPCQMWSGFVKDCPFPYYRLTSSCSGILMETIVLDDRRSLRDQFKCLTAYDWNAK